MYKKLLCILITIIITISLLCMLFLFNNKYHNNTQTSLTYLTQGELYVDELLEPSQINHNGLLVKVGSYQNYSSFHDNYSAFGKSTMVFSYHYSGLEETLSMYIQEPFSATKVYVNGKCIAQNGSFYPYHEQIKDMIVSFPAQKDNQIVILTENRTHYYSGIQYPITIGETAKVQKNILQRVFIYSLFSFSALSIALYSFILWYRDRHQKEYSIHFHFGLFAICFGLYSLYPFIPLFQITTPIFIYSMQDGLMMISVFLAYLMTLKISEYQDKGNKHVLIYSLSMCMFCFIMPFLLPYLSGFIPLYGTIISFYKLFMAGIMLYYSMKAYLHHHTIGLLLGTIIYALCLGMNVLSMNDYEPATMAWFEEFGMFVLLLCFMGLMIQRTHILWQEHQQLSFHLQEEVERQTVQINNLMKERQQLLNELLHDLKRPISTVQTYLSLLQNKDIKMQDLKQDLKILQDKYIAMNQQVKLLQNFNAQEQINMHFETIDLHHFIQEFYQMYLPDSEVYNVHFSINLCDEQCFIHGDRQQLLRVFQNLFFNALNVCQDQSAIIISLKYENENIIIIFEDHGKGISQDIIDHVFERGFTTKDDSPYNGLGLFIVKTIITLHHGSIDVTSKNHITQFIIKIPYIKIDAQKDNQ